MFEVLMYITLGGLPLIILIGVLIHLKIISRRLDETNDMMFGLHQENKRVIDRYQRNHDKLVQELTALVNKQNIPKNLMPTPIQVSQIEATLKDLVFIEYSLVQKNKVIINEFVNKIANGVQQTYPDVNQEYIVKKTIAFIEAAKLTFDE